MKKNEYKTLEDFVRPAWAPCINTKCHKLGLLRFLKTTIYHRPICLDLVDPDISILYRPI